LAIPSLLEGIADGILSTSHRVLYLARRLLCGTFGLRLGITSHLANSLFDGPFGPMHRTLDTILVHIHSPRCPQSTGGLVIWLLIMKAVRNFLAEKWQPVRLGPVMSRKAIIY
jgi:hypothetical protein